MEEENREERIQRLKNEIYEYHQLAQIQNKEMEEVNLLKRTYQKANHWSILFWCIIMLVSAAFFFNNPDIFSNIPLKVLIPLAFMISCASYLVVNSLSLFITSFSKATKDYSKWKIRRVAIIFILIAIVLIAISVRWYFGIA